MLPPMPVLAIDYDALRKALVAAVMDGCELDQNHVIMAEAEVAGAPRPALPYFTLKITTPGARYGDDSSEAVEGSSQMNYGGQRGMTVSFNAYGRSHEEAWSLAALWQARLGTPTTQGLLRKAGIAVWKPGAVADLSALLNTGYEGRAHLDCLFGVASNLTIDPGSIENVNVAGQVQTPG